MSKPRSEMITITKRELWELIKQDSFLKLLAQDFGCSGAVIKGRRWAK